MTSSSSPSLLSPTIVVPDKTIIPKSVIFSVLHATCFFTAVFPPDVIWKNDNNTSTGGYWSWDRAPRPYLYFPFLIYNLLGYLVSKDVLSGVAKESRFEFPIVMILAAILGAYGYRFLLIMPANYLPSGGYIFEPLINGAVLICAITAWTRYITNHNSAKAEAKCGSG